MKVALDTNIIAYAEGVNGERMKQTATRLLRAIPRQDLVLPVQALGELYLVLTRKAGRSPADARTAAIALARFGAADRDLRANPGAALDVSADHRIGFWDSVILAAAAAGRCRLLLSDDFQNGFSWGGVTVVNPFAQSRHPMLEALLLSGRP